MDQKQCPSFLEYARFHGIATPSTIVNPLEYIDQILENSPSSKDESSPASNSHTTPPWKSIERLLNSEKLNLGKNDARLLSTVIRDSRAERVEVNWDDCLPSLPRIEGLKVELPVLTTHHESEINALTSSVRPRGNKALPLLQTCLPYSLPKSSKNFITSHGIDEKTNTERLNCTRKSFLLIQNARKYGDISPAMDCLETHLLAYEQAFREPDLPLTPIDFDELYSPSPSPKPQMLPSPVSSTPINRHESPLCLQKTGALASIPLEFGEGGKRARGSEDEQSSNAQPEEEVRSFQEYPMPIEHASSGPMEGGNTESYEDLFHPPYSTWNLAQTVVSTRPEVELAPEHHFSARRHPTSFPSTLQSYPCFTYQEKVDDGDIDVDYSVEVEQGTQDFVEGEILETPKPLETSHGGNIDSTVVDRNWCESNIRANKQPITANDSSHNATLIPDGPAIVGETCRQQAQKCLDQTPNRQQKRKKARDDHKLRGKQHRNGKKRATMRPPAEIQGSDLSSPSTALGSLPAFMEMRGIAPKRRVNAENSYFATKNKQPIDDRTERQKSMVVVSDQYAEPVMQREERVSILSNTSASQHIPQYPRNNQEPPLLFLSTSLLKSHLRLTRILENTKDPPPTLIYRDYDTINHDLEHEADIVISPSTGAILTTSQATTQLYLPGHKPAHPHLDGIKGINSPLREHIMLLAPRYERLYVLISHSGGTAKKQPTADKRTLESITSFTAFCNSASVHSTIIPLIIAPSTPETMAQWILGLAYKHSFRLLETSVPRSIGFMPINPSINRPRVDPAMVETETQWELFLRRAGLNPFAAQVVLLALRREEEKLKLGSTYDQGTVSALSRFIEMSSETRRRLFAGLIGERVLKRVEDIMDEWQCDWALNFDAV